MLLYLLGCGCPTFAETRIIDVDDAASVTEISAVERAIADLQAWTGQAGACVAELQLTDGVEMFREGENYDVDGFYGGRFIRVDIESIDIRQTVIHEYCHAFDQVGDLSDTHPELFPVESVEESASYRSDEARRREALARACERGPADTTLLDTISDRCGEAPYDAQQRFLREEIYREAGRAEIGEPVRIVTHRRRLSGIAEDEFLVATVFADGVWWWWMAQLRRGTEEVLRSELWEVDPVRSVRGRVVSLDPALGAGRFIQAETGVHLVVFGRNTSWVGEVDLSTGRFTRRWPVPWSWVQDGVIRGDSLVVSGVGDGGELARLEDGALVDLRPEYPGEGLPFSTHDLWAAPDGVWAVRPWEPGAHGEQLRIDGAELHRAALPLAVLTLAPFIDDERQLFTVGVDDWIPVVRQGDVWRLPEDPCTPLTSSARLTPVAPNRWISMDGFDEERGMVYIEIELLE